MKADEGIRIGVSTNANATAAIDEICDQTYQEDAKLTAFFCSSYYDLDAIASRMRHRFPGTNVIGCTTAGEVGPGGYINRSISAFSLGGPTFDAVVQCVDDPARYPETEYRKLLHRSAESMHARGTLVTVRNTFGFLVLGGMSCQEEYVVSAIYGAAGDVPGFGGSAGDDFRCIETYVYYDGEFKSNRALPVLIATTRPFEVFQTQCHVETGSKLIVTAADPSRRLVMGFNGDNAASEYAEAIGVPVEELSTSVFANNPLVLRASGVAYARSVIAANPDGSLLFGCAIDQGIVLSVGKMGDMVGDLSAKLGVLRARVGEPALTICCDCAHRRMVARETQVTKEIGDVLRDFRAVGFCSYGEQYKGIHTNSALVGVMIGK